MATSSQASLHRLSSWFATPAGRRLLQEQSAHFVEHTRRFHGDSLLWAGCHTPLVDTVRGCMVRNRFLLELPASEDAVDERAEFSRFHSNLHEIPLPNNSLDALVLHHALEAAGDPRTAIREGARVLCAGGRLVVCSFNPLSLWGLRRVYAKITGDGFSGLRLVSPLRLIDWLTVLGFETETVKYIAYSMPFGGNASEARLWRESRELLARHQIPFGGVYLLSAVKQVLAQRPDLSRRSVQPGKLAPVAYPKLSAWNRLERPG